MREERLCTGSGAVIYVIRLEGEGADEAMEQEWDLLQRYCDEEGLTVCRVITERVEDCYVGSDDDGGYRREIDFEKRPGGRSALEGLKDGAAHLVLTYVSGLNDDPRRASRQIRKLEEMGVTVHLVDDFTPNNAAELLGVSVAQIRRWLREGEIEGHKDGGRWWVDQRSLLDFVTAPPGPDSGAVVYMIRFEGEDGDEGVEQEWDFLQWYCDEEGLAVLRVIPESAQNYWQSASDADVEGDWRETDFDMRPGGQSALESFEGGAAHLVLTHLNRLYDDPRRASRLIRQLEKTGVGVHLASDLTPVEASAYFEVSADQIRKWLREEAIEGYKDGGRWRVDQHSLLDLMTWRYDQEPEDKIPTFVHILAGVLGGAEEVLRFLGNRASRLSRRWRRNSG